MDTTNAPDSSTYNGWQTLVAEYQKPDVRISIWQIVNSVGGFILGWILMYFSMRVGYWLTILLAFPTAGFVMRIFIIQHDCGHGSFFKSRKANDWVGNVCGALTQIPYKYWRKGHSIHHAHHAELEGRGTGDIWTLTVDEYKQSPLWQRFGYRVARNPFFFFVIAPPIYFGIMQRFPISNDGKWKASEKASVWWTNLAVLGWTGTIVYLIGFQAFFMIYLPILVISGSVATWLFYVQHQFEDTYWEHTPQWEYTLAAMQGSSYYKLPLILQWFSGNIGFHHIHHLSPRIPNYNLPKCHDEVPVMQQAVQLTILSSLKSMSLALWDEKKRRLVSFREAFAATS